MRIGTAGLGVVAGMLLLGCEAAGEPRPAPQPLAAGYAMLRGIDRPGLRLGDDSVGPGEIQRYLGLQPIEWQPERGEPFSLPQTLAIVRAGDVVHVATPNGEGFDLRAEVPMGALDLILAAHAEASRRAAGGLGILQSIEHHEDGAWVVRLSDSIR